jgi:hypothetical protein
VTETPPGTDSTDGRDGEWNRQTSTVDWEGWIAEANEADARRATAQAASAPPDQFPAPHYPGYQSPAPQAPRQQAPSAHYPAPQFPANQPNYPPPTGYAPAGGYPPPGAPFQPFQAPTKPQLDVVSVLALIFGILPTALIGLVLGIVGIVRTAHPARRGRGLAVTGLVLSLLWVAVAVAIPVLVHNGDTRSAAGGPVSKATTMSPTLLRADDCYTDTVLTSRQAPSHKAVQTVKVVPCSQPHNAVVYAVTTLPAGAWTSQVDKLTIANQQCRPLAMQYFNGIVLNPNLRLGAFAPDATRWELGFHNASCVVVDPDKSFVGDIRQDR